MINLSYAKGLENIHIHIKYLKLQNVWGILKARFSVSSISNSEVLGSIFKRIRPRLKPSETEWLIMSVSVMQNKGIFLTHPQPPSGQSEILHLHHKAHCSHNAFWTDNCKWLVLHLCNTFCSFSMDSESHCLAWIH